MRKLLFLAALAAVSTGPASAADKRQVDAHQHGITVLYVAADGNQITIDLEGPAMNFVGFEHPPRTDQQQAAVADAVAALENGGRIFQFNSSAACELASADSQLVSNTIKADKNDAADGEHVDRNHYSNTDGDNRTETAHSEFVAYYNFTCARPANLRELTVDMFERFPLNVEAEVSFIGDSFQTFKELNSADKTILVSP